MFDDLQLNADKTVVEGLPKNWVTVSITCIAGTRGNFTHCAVICAEEMLPKDSTRRPMVIMGSARAILFATP